MIHDRTESLLRLPFFDVCHCEDLARPVELALLALVLLVMGCGGSDEFTRLDTGDPLPGFTLPALAGGEVSSDSLAGRPVVLNFWATWCVPCLKEIPELKELAREGRAEVVGIALDAEGAAAVRPFVEQHGMGYTILLGNQEIFQRMGGISIPYTLVLDPSLKLIDLYRGPATKADVDDDLGQVDASAPRPPEALPAT